jgi:thiol-disulfide isomerase/thioredoxin
MSSPRSSIRKIVIQSLGSFGLGLFVLGIVIGSTFLSNDIRLLVLLGAIALLVCGFFAGAKIGRGWLAGALLCLPLCAGFAFTVLQQLPFLWPTLLVWPVAGFTGLFFFSGRRSRCVFVSAMITLLIFSAWYCVAYIPNQMQRAMSHTTNDSAPAFQFDSVSEGDVPRTASPGKILVIDFFATWCRPCVEELPELKAVRNELQDRPDIEFVVVATNRGGDTPERFREFAKRRPIGLPLAFDPAGKAHAVFGFSGFPSLAVIDRAGRTRLKHEGYNSSEVNFHRDLVQLLRTL